jgi:hypothetical protein
MGCKSRDHSVSRRRKDHPGQSVKQKGNDPEIPTSNRNENRRPVTMNKSLFFIFLTLDINFITSTSGTIGFK